MAEGDNHFTILPGAVRKYEIEQPPLFAGRLAFEQRLCVACEFENPHALVHVGLLGFLMAFDIAQAARLLLPPLPRHPVVKIAPNLSIELVDIHRVDAVLEPVVFGMKPLDRLLMLAPLVGVAGLQRLAHPFQNLVVEAQLPEHGRELLLQHLLAGILATAGGGLASAFVGIACTVVVDVLLLLDLADHRASAFRTGDQPGEGEVVGHAPVLAGMATVHHALHPLPQLDRHQRLVLALVQPV